MLQPGWQSPGTCPPQQTPTRSGAPAGRKGWGGAGWACGGRRIGRCGRFGLLGARPPSPQAIRQAWETPHNMIAATHCAHGPAPSHVPMCACPRQNVIRHPCHPCTPPAPATWPPHAHPYAPCACGRPGRTARPPSTTPTCPHPAPAGPGQSTWWGAARGAEAGLSTHPAHRSCVPTWGGTSLQHSPAPGTTNSGRRCPPCES